MSRRLSLYLTDIINSIEKIQNYTANLTYENLCEDDKTLDAVVHNLLIIGEATKQIPNSVRIKYSQIEWKQIAGLRDVIAHSYFSINSKLVWDIIQTKLDPLQSCIQQILETENLENY
ncbi:HepT-like ribonuclease domain-containing protein [Dactylococcopsis salina]|uniref:Nucleotidyltransferase n=1 Tax=Dactylococcopsis salina (strain PCC 8305) TaxID=13035 RepID=K9YW62_DACS8|nr:DUF86 domain-containing protein [Dactylococcopsis salina]AFZ50585.1 hypothetical protein Dacsa_1934 [Dactylococcopsis salina PCC 8305]